MHNKHTQLNTQQKALELETIGVTVRSHRHSKKKKKKKKKKKRLRKKKKKRKHWGCRANNTHVTHTPQWE